MAFTRAHSIHERHIIDSNVTFEWQTSDPLKRNLHNNQRLLVSV